MRYIDLLLSEIAKSQLKKKKKTSHPLEPLPRSVELKPLVVKNLHEISIFVHTHAADEKPTMREKWNTGGKKNTRNNLTFAKFIVNDMMRTPFFI